MVSYTFYYLGPLVLSKKGDDYPGQSGPPTLIGVVSLGPIWCGIENEYDEITDESVFARVSSVVDWIKMEINRKL